MYQVKYGKVKTIIESKKLKYCFLIKFIGSEKNRLLINQAKPIVNTEIKKLN